MSSNSTNSIEITLEETLEYLQDQKCERENEVKKLMNIVKNNEVRTIPPNITPDEIRQKRLKFVQAVEKFVSNEQPKDLVLPDAPDFYSDVLKALEEEVHKMEELNKIADKEIFDLESDITYLEKKKAGFQQIQEATLLAVDCETTNYEKEMVVTKQVFVECKTDLAIVVDKLFPGNSCFQNFLMLLTRALSKGGDDLYIDIEPNFVSYALFLEEVNIAQFHPNDKTKIKLLNL